MQHHLTKIAKDVENKETGVIFTIYPFQEVIRVFEHDPHIAGFLNLGVATPLGVA